MSKPSRSAFAGRIDALALRWARLIPDHLRRQFQDEVAAFGAEFDSTLETIEDIWRRREHDYAVDETTGLARRRPFLEHLVALIETPATPLVRAIGVLFVDVDQLKRINDTFGHDAGDRAVTATGAIIRDTIRAGHEIDFMARTRLDADYAVSRHGGDEFLVALELRDAADIEVVATRLKESVEDPARQRSHGYDVPMPLAVSVGGVVFELASPPALASHVVARSLVSAADQEMYKAKRDGRIHVTAARFHGRVGLDRTEARVVS